MLLPSELAFLRNKGPSILLWFFHLDHINHSSLAHQIPFEMILQAGLRPPIWGKVGIPCLWDFNSPHWFGLTSLRGDRRGLPAGHRT